MKKKKQLFFVLKLYVYVDNTLYYTSWGLRVGFGLLFAGYDQKIMVCVGIVFFPLFQRRGFDSTLSLPPLLFLYMLPTII
jgi:hypothetical protein